MAKRTNANNNRTTGGSTSGPGQTARSSKAKSGGGKNSGGSRDPPIAIAATVSNRGPGYSTRGSIRVTNSEFVYDILATSASSTAGTIQGFDLNPAAGNLFTWLTRIANSYELFRFHKLRAIYTPICPSTTAGVVVLGFDYDASDTAPATKQAISAYQGSTRGNVWNRLTCDLSPPKGWYYVGQNSQPTINPANTDIKFYDAAKLYVGLFNTVTTQMAVGELTIEYDVEFAKPDFGPGPVLAERVEFPGSSLTSLAGPSPATYGSTPMLVSSSGAGNITLTFTQAGEFLIEWVSVIKSTAGLGTPFGPYIQQDPGAATVPGGAYLEYIGAAWVNATTAYPTLNVMAVVVQIGTVITMSTVAAVTEAAISRMRAASYKKSIG